MTPDTPVHILESKRQQVRALMMSLGFAEGFSNFVAERSTPGNVDEVLATLQDWNNERNEA